MQCICVGNPFQLASQHKSISAVHLRTFQVGKAPVIRQHLKRSLGIGSCIN